MDDLKLIKKHYGEKMSHLCRELFPTLLETPGLLFNTLSKKFDHSKLLYEDISNHISEFKTIIYNEVDLKEQVKEVTKTPAELLDEAGYILYECHSEEDIQKFRKYYTPREELCTFRGGRLNSCHVFFAVKKNVDEILRENYTNPERQDEYGTSVISFQFSRGNPNTLSIKNRYNHTVPNPDATFSNNLDNIIEGLTDSFAKTYNLNINSSKVNVDIPGFVLASDGKYYKYNFEINNVYYCPNNILIRDFMPRQYDKSRFILMDKYLLNIKEKELREYLPRRFEEDSFCDLDIKKIEIKKNKEDNTKDIIINDDIIITIDETNQIIKYKNHHLRQNTSNFLQANRKLRELDAPNIVLVNNNFLKNNLSLEKLNLPNATEIRDNVLKNNRILKEIKLPNVEEIGEDFLFYNEELLHLNLPKVRRLNSGTRHNNEKLESLKLSKVEFIGHNSFTKNLKLKKLCLPEARSILTNCFSMNKIMKKIILPKVWELGNGVFENNQYAEKIYIPKLVNIPDKFLYNNNVLYELNLPSVMAIGNDVLQHNESIRKIVLENVKQIGEGFLSDNERVRTIIMPKVQKIGTCSIYSFKCIEKIEMPILLEWRDITDEMPEPFKKRHAEIQGENGLKVEEKIREIINNNLKEITEANELIHNYLKEENKPKQYIK